MDAHFPGELKAVDQMSRGIVFIYFMREITMPPSFTCHSCDMTSTGLSSGYQKGEKSLGNCVISEKSPLFLLPIQHLDETVKIKLSFLEFSHCIALAGLENNINYFSPLCDFVSIVLF